MNDPRDEIATYEQQTIVLRLDHDEATALVSLLVEVPPDHPHKDEATLLADKAASEYFEHFARRLA